MVSWVWSSKMVATMFRLSRIAAKSNSLRIAGMSAMFFSFLNEAWAVRSWVVRSEELGSEGRGVMGEDK